MCRKRSAGRALFLTACLQPHYGFRVFIIKHPGVEREGGEACFLHFPQLFPTLHSRWSVQSKLLHAVSCATCGENSAEGSNFTHYKFFSDTE